MQPKYKVGQHVTARGKRRGDVIVGEIIEVDGVYQNPEGHCFAAGDISSIKLPYRLSEDGTVLEIDMPEQKFPRMTLHAYTDRYVLRTWSYTILGKGPFSHIGCTRYSVNEKQIVSVAGL